MVQAILAGRKTQTRRILKQQDIRIHSIEGWPASSTGEVKCPYGQVGDVLWVRETWDFGYPYAYKADGALPITKWRPSIHMPKAACRLFLRITNVRVERLQDISEEDAIAEGVSRYPKSPIYGYKNYLHEDMYCLTAVDSFRTLWHSINGEQSWNDNPWVWVVEFERIEK